MTLRSVAGALVAALLGVLSPFAANAQPSPVERGTAWLAAQPQSNGSVQGESGSLATAFQVRTEALYALKILATAPGPLADAVGIEPEASTEHLARKVAVLAAVGRDVAAPLASLLLRQNGDGGYGPEVGFQSTVLDTAFALLALKAASSAPSEATARALGYLVASQGADGAFSWNEQPSVHVTAYALHGMNGFAQGYPLAAPIDRSRSWLVARQTEGAYATVLDNALGAIALAGAASDPAVVSGAKNALKAAQAADGSWAADPYLTALALRALLGWEGGFGNVRGTLVDASTGAAIAGATIMLSSPGSSAVISDTQGRFLIEGARSGVHTLSVSVPGYGVLAVQAGVTAGQTLDLGVLKLTPDAAVGATLRGTVADAATRQPLAGALVAVTVGTQTYSTTTDAAGGFVLADLPAGTASIKVDLAAYRTLTASQALAAGQAYTLSMLLNPLSATGAQLQGRVLSAANGAPIPGATVTLSNFNTGVRVTDAVGRFSFTGLGPLDTKITVSAPNFATRSVTVILVNGQTMEVVIPLQPASPGDSPAVDLLGRVVDSQTLAAIPGAAIVATYGGASRSLSADGSGSFTLPAYSGGAIQLVITSAGYEAGNYTVDPGFVMLPNLGSFPLVRERIGDKLADLTIASISRSGVVETAAQAVSGTLKATVRNAGTSATPGTFAVAAFLDVDLDAAFTQGIDVRLGEARVAGPLASGASIDLEIALNGVLPFAGAPIHVWADSGREVAEGDEGDNVVSSCVFCYEALVNTTVPATATTSPTLQFGADFAPHYQAYLLGPVPGVPLRYGFVLPKLGDPNTLLIGGAANVSTGGMYAVKVVRDKNLHIVGFNGAAQKIADAPFNEGGAIYFGPANHILYAQWPVNKLGIYKPGETAPGKVIDLRPFNVDTSFSSLQQVPAGYPGAGSLKFTTYGGGAWFDVKLAPDANGYFDIQSITRIASSTITGGPEGIIYVPKASPGFARDGMLVSEFTAGRLSAYELDANGNPLPASRKLFLGGVTGAEGAAIDPLTGDYVFTTFGGLNQAVVVRGFRKVQGLTDLSVSKGTVTLDGAGRVTAIAVRVGNAGPEVPPASKVAFFALRNGTRAEKLGEAAVAPLASGAYADLRFALAQATTLPGVLAVVDPDEVLSECAESNNTLAIAVEPLLGLVQVRTEYPGYVPGATAAITTTVTNPGTTAKSYFIEVSIRDHAGAPVASFPRATAEAVAPGGFTAIATRWTVANLFAGGYRAVASLYNADGQPIGTAETAFNILVSTAFGQPLSASLVTDKVSYQPLETVLVTARVRNEQANAFLENLRVVETITDMAGAIVYAGEQAIAQVSPSGVVELAFSARLGSAARGPYTIEQKVFGAGAMPLDVRSARIEVLSTSETGTGLGGTLVATPKRLNAGDPVTLEGLLANRGNSPVEGLAVALRVVEPATELVLQAWNATLNVAGDPVPFSRTWETTNVAAGSYVAVLVATVGGREAALAQETITLGAVRPFEFAPRVDVSPGAIIESNSVTIAGLLVPASISISGGEYRIGSGDWKSVPGLVEEGSMVAVRTVAASSTNTAKAATLRVAGFSAPFEVTTIADRTPDAFAFAPQADVPVSTVLVSNTVNITGIDVAVPIQIAGGEYRINDGPWTAAAGTIAGGSSLTLRLASAPTLGTTTTATVTIGNVSAAFRVTTLDVADVGAALQFSVDTRLLVLLSCENSQAGGYPACLEERRTFLALYLARLGIAHAVVTDAERFTVELRGGRYNTYWIAGGAEKLGATLIEELREATFRGDGLIADGVRDDRNRFMQATLGASFQGQLASPGNVVLSATFLPAGSFVPAGDAIRLAAVSGSRAAGFGTADGPPAIVTNRHGAGRSVLFAFDLVATLMSQPGAALLQATIGESVEEVAPPPAESFAGAGLVRFEAALENREAVPVEVDLVAVLPEFVLDSASAQPVASRSGETRWRIGLAARSSLAVSWSYRAPLRSATYAGSLTLNHVQGAQSRHIRTLPLSVQVRALDTLLPQVIGELQSLSITSAAHRQARDRAVSSLQRAQGAAAQQQFAAAIDLVLETLREVDTISGGLDTAAQRSTIDRVLQELEARWWMALPACPAPHPCRN